MFTRPISLVLMTLAAIAFLVPFFNAIWKVSRRQAQLSAADVGENED